MSAQSARIVDTVDFASAPSRAAHLVRSVQGAPVNARVALGTLKIPFAGMRLEAGGSVKARVNTPAEGAPLSLMVTLATASGDFGKLQAYRIRIGGREVYSATERDMGGGVTRSFFLEAPPGTPLTEVEIAELPTTEAAITVSSLRCYSGLVRPAGAVDPTAAPRPDERMGLALVSPKGMGYEVDNPTLTQIYHTLPQSPYIERQAAILYNFSKRTAGENRKEIDRLAALARATLVPLRIAFQMHWGGAPTGISDGAGGAFTDLPYQQLTYDPDDKVDDPGLAALMGDRYDVRYGLSTPNRWSDTPWLTFNHPRLNQLRRVRLTQALGAWREARAGLAASGNAKLFPAELSTGDETVYWAKGVDDSKYTELNGGKPRRSLSADFNPFVVTDALREGVNLDPRNGLDRQERVWLHQNLARQQQRIVDWMFEALPADPIRVDAGAARFAGDLVRRNLYTEPYAMPLFPMQQLSPYRPGIENGYVSDGHSGGEYWSGAQMLPWLIKERERGRSALPNLECTGASDGQLVACLGAAYACGVRYATLYNWQKRDNAGALLREFASRITAPAGMEWPQGAGFALPSGRREFVARDDAFGVNVLELFPAAGAEIVTLRVRLKDLEEGTESIAVALPHREGASGRWRVTLPGLFALTPRKRYLLEVKSVSGNPLALQPATDNGMAGRLAADLPLERGRSVAIQAWQDAVDLLASLKQVHERSPQSLFATSALAAAETLLAQQKPKEAYLAGIKAEQLSLPAAYEVAAPGSALTPYTIAVSCPAGPVRATILTYTAQAATVSLRSEMAQTVTLRWGGLETTAALSPNIPAEVSLARRAPVQPVRPVRKWRGPRRGRHFLPRR